jgi:hypothetical protein
MKRIAFTVFVVFACLLTLTRTARAGCPVSVPIMSFNADNYGTLNLPEMAGRHPGPAIRFWGYGQFAAANNGNAPQFNPGSEWLWNATRAGMPGAAPSQFVLGPSVNWLSQDTNPGNQIIGCVSGPGSRMVIECSYLNGEGSPSHYCAYLVFSIAFDLGNSAFNLNNVQNGNGLDRNDVKADPVPVPQPAAGAGTASKIPGYESSFMEVPLILPDARSYGDSGAPNLINGYLIYYANDAEPVSSIAGTYQQVKSPGNPRVDLGVVHYGAGQVMVAVPTPKQFTVFLTQIVYQDPSVMLTSMGTSGNSRHVAAPAGSDSPEGASGPTGDQTGSSPEGQDGTPEPSATPTPLPAYTPKPDPTPAAASSGTASEGAGGSQPRSAAGVSPAGGTAGGASSDPARPEAGGSASALGGVPGLPGRVLPGMASREEAMRRIQERNAQRLAAAGGSGQPTPVALETPTPGTLSQPGAGIGADAQPPGASGASGVPGLVPGAPVSGGESTAEGPPAPGGEDLSGMPGGGDGGSARGESQRASEGAPPAPSGGEMKEAVKGSVAAPGTTPPPTKPRSPWWWVSDAFLAGIVLFLAYLTYQGRR